MIDRKRVAEARRAALKFAEECQTWLDDQRANTWDPQIGASQALIQRSIRLKARIFWLRQPSQKPIASAPTTMPLEG